MRIIALGGSMLVLWCGSALGAPAAAPLAAPEKATAKISVSVDPRVELMSIIFRLAGNPEYGQGKVPSYTQDVEEHFGRFRTHAVVKLATKLRQTRGVSYDAVMGMAVHITDAVTLQEKVPFSPQPKTLDARWTPETAREFLTLARLFVAETRFQDFFDLHEPLYRVGVQRMQEVLDKHAHLDWFDRFFGPRKGADFHVVLGMLNGGGSYGARVTRPDGQEELYSVIGVWMVDSGGQPTFTPGIASTIVHEFTHSYTNPLVDQFAAQLQGPGEKLYPLVEKEMRGQAYAGWKTLMYESLNRACGLRYTLATDGLAAMNKAAAYQAARSFYWVGELADVLGEYDTQPRKYKDLAEFFPRITAFFEEYAKDADAKIGAIKGKKEGQIQEWRDKGPKIVSLVPANGAEDVDPGLKAIVVTFDRPMRDKCWSVVTPGSQDEFPKSAGPVGYDATRKVFTMPVTLEPDKEYHFGLNSEQFAAFQSEEGIPLAPVEVRFKTRPGDKKEGQIQDKGPKIVSMAPANGAQDVDPSLKAIVVTFDRPMRDKCWSVVTLGSQDEFPKLAGSVHYDATRKVFTVPVTLQPDKEYRFGLNSGRFNAFQSEQGIHLAPVVVRFKIRPLDK
jgi:hypothetical protein